MNNKELNMIALQTAKNILKVSDENKFRFQIKGSVREWDETVYKTIFEVVYNIFKITYIVDLEMDSETGEVLSCKEIEINHEK
jgi:hypothetical protein